MSEPEFSPGQRWVSNTEPELGLGIVSEIAHRRVQLSFPAVGEERAYASDNAPLSRVRYKVGDEIRTGDELRVKVNALEEHDGCIIYAGIDEHGSEVNLHEIELDSFVQFSRPLDRMFTGQIDKNGAFQLRVDTLAHQHKHRCSPAYGLLGSRVALLPHQFYIASQVGERHAPRVLLADEVGLGKTIEAGLIAHRQLFCGQVSRVLVVVPEHLVHQWLVEMLRRFNLRFSIMDEETVQALLEAGEDNPFETAQLVLTSLSFLASSEDYRSLAADAGWDMLIVDEAHHLSWSEETASPEYTCIETLAARIPALLLLSATPEQLGVSGHFARLRLLDPHRYHSLQQWLAEEADYQGVSQVVQALLVHESLDGLAGDSGLRSQLETYIGPERLGEILDSDAADQGVQTLVSELIDRHGTGRVMFRNCRDSVSGFMARQLHSWPLPAPSGLASSDANGEDDIAALLHPELLLGDDWVERDPRAQWLESWLRENRSEKALVICARASTAIALENWLRVRHGVRSAVFHEGMELIVRDRAAAYFSEAQEGAQVLISSEIGSEGRNFQFARHLVLFDLPLIPDLLEQRIGRLDRIGQRHDVQIHVPHYENTAQALLLRWLHEGVNAFEATSNIGSALLEEFGPALLSLMRGEAAEDVIEKLLSETAGRASELAQALQEGRDRLLELASLDAEQAEQIVTEVGSAARPLELSEYMSAVFDQYGVENNAASALSAIVKPGDHMLCHAFPALPDEGLTITYDRSQALSREDMHFLTWEHPMVTGAMDMIHGSEFGNTALGTVKAPPLPAGTLLMEAYFVVHCPAPRALQLARFLPVGSVRVVVDSHNRTLGDTLSAQWFSRSIQSVPRRTGVEVVKQVRGQIEALAEQCTMIAEGSRNDLVDEALALLRQDSDSEITRLRELSRLNPNIREEEISWLEQSRDARAEYIGNAQLRLDAVRVAIVT